MSKAYYLAYYDTKKHLYKQRYLEKKQERIDLEYLYQDFGGEKAYYRMKMLEFCSITVNNNINKNHLKK